MEMENDLLKALFHFVTFSILNKILCFQVNCKTYVADSSDALEFLEAPVLQLGELSGAL